MKVELILLSLFAFGSVFLFLDQLEILYEKIKYKLVEIRIFFTEDSLSQMADPSNLFEKLMVHIAQLLKAAFFIGNKAAVTGFCLISAGLGAIVFVLSLKAVPLYISAFAFLITLLVPYMILAGQVQIKRIGSSLEGEILVTEILNNYKFNYCNMRQAIEITAMTIETAPYSKKLLLNLAKGLNNSTEGKGLEILIEDFRFAIGTSWAGILATNIYLACQYGIRVTESLSDLAESMKKAREVEEYSKRENNESFLILKYLIPISGILFILGGMYLFEMSLGEFLHLQFGTSAGITWFSLWLISYIGAIALNILLTKRKFDL